MHCGDEKLQIRPQLDLCVCVRVCVKNTNTDTHNWDK